MTTAISAETRTALRDALAAIDRGDRPAAAGRATGLAGADDRAARLLGARLLFLLRSYDEALAALRRQIDDQPDDAYTARLRFAWLKRLRFDQEADAALPGLMRQGDDPRVLEAAALHYQATGRTTAALQQLDRLLVLAPDNAHRYRAQLRLAVDAHDPVTARRAAEQALAREPARWLDVVEQLLQVGVYDLAESAAGAHRPAPEADAVMALLALYRGDAAAAYRMADDVRRRRADDERAATVLVAAAALEGDDARAAADLARWPGEPGPTLRLWGAELLWRRRDLEGARRELARVQNEIPDFLAAKLLWVLVKAELDGESWATTTAFDGLLEGQLQSLGIEVRFTEGRVAMAWLKAAAADALARLGGNRSPFPTLVRDGRLVPVRVPASLRHRVRLIQHRARWLGLARTQAVLAAELAGIGPHPIAECYDAELDLWSGDYPTAHRKFDAIVRRAPRTTWGWIGLGASRALLGDAAGALQTLDEGVRVMGFRGATVPVYRGEALFRLGRFDEAEAQLREASALHPGRVAAWLLRLLVAQARGHAAERDELFAHLDRVAAPLLADAARAAGASGWWPARPDGDTQVAVASQALALMRGNRSSSCALWIAPGGDVVRSVFAHRPVAPPDWERQERRQLQALTRA